MADETEKLRVLWVEDEKPLVEIFSEVFRISGLDKSVEVTWVTDGDTAIKRLEEINPHFFITDYAHPGMDGERLLEFLAQRRFPHPVVYFCGLVSNESEVLKRFEGLELSVLSKVGGVEPLLGKLAMAACKHQINNKLAARQRHPATDPA